LKMHRKLKDFVHHTQTDGCLQNVGSNYKKPNNKTK